MAKAVEMSLIKFQKEFRTEEDCVSYLSAQKWKDGFHPTLQAGEILLHSKTKTVRMPAVCSSDLRDRWNHHA